jgi:hypothetical protein
VEKYLFDPKDEYPAVTEFRRVNSWGALQKELLAA